MPQPILFSQSQYVSVAHRYWDNQWSHEENRRHYGAQASEQGVGSNMRVEIGKLSNSDENVDLVVQLARAKKLLDHRCLFTEVEEFKDRPSTLENIVLYLSQNLDGYDSLRVEENDKLACTKTAGSAELLLEMKVMNLHLFFWGKLGQNGLVIPRAQVTQAVMDEFKDLPASGSGDESTWSKELFAKLALRVNLQRLRIDLGRQKYILVNSSS